MIGKSWVSMLKGEEESARTQEDYLAWELFGGRALRQGEWKIRWQLKPFGTGDWELFNLAEDPSERSDLAVEHPETLHRLTTMWEQYVRDNNVILPNRSPFEGNFWTMPHRFTPIEDSYPPLLFQTQFIPPQDMLAEPNG